MCKKNPKWRTTCFACGAELIWNADYMRSELEDCDESEDCVVNCLTCSGCGAEVRVYQVNK